jgi:predicted esterase
MGRIANWNWAINMMEDSELYENEPDFRQPTLIFHGTRDTVVPLSVSEALLSTHKNVQLKVFESGHELTDVMESMWKRTREFLTGLDCVPETLMIDS